jgi:hypothetical protein
MTNETPQTTNNGPLEILVVEDKERHILSAEKLLVMHKVHIARTFNDACQELDNPNRVYDAILSDMFFPYGKNCASDEGNQPDAIGYAISLYAARKNVPIISIVTDSNHHSNPVSATFDCFADYTIGSSELVARPCLSRPIIKLNNSLFAMFDIRDCRPLDIREGNVVYEGWGYEKGVKNWIDILDSMLNPGKQIKPRPQ